MQQGSYNPIQTTISNYPQMYSSAYPYQPINFYYNNFSSNIQPYYYPQSLSIISKPNNQTTSPSKDQNESSQSQRITQKSIQQDQLQDEQQKFQQQNSMQEKINIVSYIFEINQEEAKELLSQNICLCCMNKIVENNNYNGNGSTRIEDEKATKMEQQSEKNQKFQIPQTNLNLKQSNNKLYSDNSCKNIKTHSNNHQKYEQNSINSNPEREILLLPSKKIKVENANIEENEMKLDLLNEEKLKSLNKQKINSLEKSVVQQMSQQDVESEIQKQQKKDMLQIKLINSLQDSKEISSSQDHSTHSKEGEKKTVSYAIIRKQILKQDKGFINFKKRKIPQIENSQIFSLNNNQQQFAYQNNSDYSQVQTQINQQPSNQSITSLSSYFIKNQKDKNSEEQQNDSIMNEQSIKSNKEFQNDSNYTKNLLKGFKRVVTKNYGNNKEFMTEFNKYFDSFPLNNEFILKLFSDSPYSVYFIEFLSTDPTWWIKEARIKDTESQIEFFEICRRRQFTQIRTKRKKFIRPKLI